MVGVREWDLSLEGTGAYLKRFSPDGPIRVGIVIAVVDVAQVVDVGIEVCYQ